MADEGNLPSHSQTSAELAYEAKMQGRSLSDIGLELGMSPQSVNNLIQGQMTMEAQFYSAEERKGLLAMEIARLDRLQSAAWEAALMNDPKSMDAVLKIIDKRTKLLGLDVPDAKDASVQVLVIGGMEKDYVEALKDMALEKGNSGIDPSKLTADVVDGEVVDDGGDEED